MSLVVVELFTDGACSGNPGPGGWGVLLRHRDQQKTLSGGEAYTTNNRMELMAAIQGLSALRRRCKVKLYTDSQYLKKGMTQWLDKWIRQSWKNAAKKPVQNQDLWQTLARLREQHDIEWHWVRGHAGHPENEFADALAREALSRFMS